MIVMDLEKMSNVRSIVKNMMLYRNQIKGCLNDWCLNFANTKILVFRLYMHSNVKER